MNNPFAQKIRLKVMLVFLGLLALGIGSAYVQVKHTEKRIMEQVVSEQGALTRQLLSVFSRQITSQMDSIEQTTFLLSDLSIVQRYLASDSNKELGQLVQDAFENVELRQMSVLSIRLINLNGDTLVKVTPEKSLLGGKSAPIENISSLDYFSFFKQVSMNEVGRFMGDPQEYTEPHLEIMAPVYDGFLPMGYVVQTISVGLFIDEILNLIGKEGAFLLLLSQQGNHIFGESSKLLTQSSEPLSNGFSFAGRYPMTWSRIQAASSLRENEVWREQQLYFTIHPLEIRLDNLGAYQSWLVAYFSEQQVEALASPGMINLNARFLMMSLGALLLAVLWSWWIYRRSMMQGLSFMAQAAMRSMSPIVLLDLDQNILKANDEFLRLMDADDDLLGRHMSSLLNSDDREKFEKIWSTLPQNRVWKGELRFQDRQGKSRIGLFQLFPLESKGNRVMGYVGSWVDISEQKALEQRLRSLTVTDALTGCKNRRFFDKALKDLFETQQRHPEQTFCLAIADIDHFKRVNDEFGHDVGDEVLQAFAHVLEQETRTLDIVCRVGGEEFAVILPNTRINDALHVIERVRQTVENNSMADHAITSSFGVTCSAGADNDDGLYKMADQALYQAKQNGRNRVEVFESD